MVRRLTVCAVTLAAALAVPILGQVQTKDSQAAVTPSRALDMLKEGNARFVGGKMKARDLKAAVMATAAGQYPVAAVIGCMDSRAPIEVVFDQGLGDVFGLRVAGNVVDKNFLGSLEYATKVVGVKLILVMGHTHCGAVKGAIDDVKLGSLTALLADIEPAIAAAGPPRGTSKDDAFVDRVAAANVRLQMRHIREGSAVVREMLDSGKVGLVGSMYDIDSGKVVFFAD
jgi:carbonic anhydrase